ncbi:hypothetical protein F383_34037 [Gossypium arboreum]|uniref:Uncharacterized protein n=1 Tax=Gossypium arboreum TaxID=29729 RepID=A0A0B0PR62_GOSAR|nr:hypothetical protein F383_34037 [Gossypium arboreum]
MGLFEPKRILARNPSSTSISTKKGEENYGSPARCGCAGARVRVVREGRTEVRKGSYGSTLEARAAAFLATRVLS